MFIQPRLNASLDVHAEIPNLLFLLDEHRKVVMQGAIYPLLVPFLDGEHDISQILAGVGDRAQLFDVYQALNALTQNGCLVEGLENPKSNISAYQEYIRPIKVGHYQAFEKYKLAIHAIGNTDASLLSAALTANGVTVDNDNSEILIVLTDDYARPELESLNSEHLINGRPWLLAKPEGMILWVGPFFIPGSTGCWSCLSQRLTANRQAEKFIQEQRGSKQPVVTSVAKLPAAHNVAYHLLATQITELLITQLNSPLHGKLMTIDLLSHEIQFHNLVKRPQCPSCGDPGLMAKQMLAPVTLSSGKKRYCQDGGHRTMTPDETYQIYQHHISPILGAVTELRPAYGSDNELTHSYVAGHNFSMGLDSIAFLRESLRGVSGGKGSVKIQAMVSGLCEAIERYSGNYFGDEYSIQGRFLELNDAIHPNTCMGFSPSQLQEREAWNASHEFSRCHFVPEQFDEHRVIDWTPIWSLSAKKFRYLPSLFCFYGHPDFKNNDWCVPDSNGSAAGNTLEEAIIQGFMELVERDAVAIWWYNRIQRRGVDLDSFDMPYLNSIREYYAAMHRDIWVIDITSDLNIATFACVSRRNDHLSEDLLLGFGSHFDPRIAMLRAITEVNQFLPSVALKNPDGSTRYIFGDELARNWWKTATIADHPYLKPLDDLPPANLQDFNNPSSDDIKEDVETCLAICAQNGLEMLVLNQTRPDLGLNVVKVIVPELCHFWRRLGKSRLYDVPVTMGWLQSRPNIEHFNPYTIFF